MALLFKKCRKTPTQHELYMNLLVQEQKSSQSYTCYVSSVVPAGAESPCWYSRTRTCSRLFGHDLHAPKDSELYMAVVFEVMKAVWFVRAIAADGLCRHADTHQ